MLRRPCVAIVGARNASAIACRFARQLAADLAARDVTVVSGLARGVDTAAHIGALGGSTVGVIASGIDIAFPPENAALQEKIATDQLLVAEQPPGSEPLARHFPSRNRIIAGLAHGTVVIEAAPRSGSLITARRAGDYGREVMAVPGSPLDPRAQGCNLLIREGATLIQTVDDVLEALGPIDTRMVREPAPAPVMPPLNAVHANHAARSGSRRDRRPARADPGRSGRNCAAVGTFRGSGATRPARTRTGGPHRTPRRRADQYRLTDIITARNARRGSSARRYVLSR